MFLAAAQALSRMVTEQDLAVGSLYPPLTDIRKVSLCIAEAVAKTAYEADLAREPEPKDLTKFIATQMYDPKY